VQNYKFKMLLTFACLSVPFFNFSGEKSNSVAEMIKFDKEKASEPFSWMIWKDQVKPEEQKIYEEKVATIINKAKEHPNFIRILTFYESTTSTYYFFYPFLDESNWNKIYSFWSEEAERVGTKKHLVNYSIFLTKSFPDLSQVPLSGQVSLSNPNFVHMEHFQLQPDSEEKFKQLLNEWALETRSKAPDCGWFVQKMIVSQDLPTYMILSGDCLKNAENIVQLNKFFLEKQAYGPVIKKIISEDKIYISKLSTTPLNLSGK